MNKYEIVYILTPDLEKEQVEESNNSIKSVIEKYGGEPGELDLWGKKRLAYEINDYQEGIYALLTFSGDRTVTDELERSLKMDERVIRYLLTKQDN